MTPKPIVPFPNPYRPPESEPELVDVEVGEEKWTTRHRNSAGAIVAAAIAYIAFDAILLTSTPLDVAAGKLWAINVPVLLSWVLLIWFPRSGSKFLGYAAAIVQAGIGVAMWKLKIGDIEAVIVVNAVVALIFIALAVNWQRTIRLGRARA